MAPCPLIPVCTIDSPVLPPIHHLPFTRRHRHSLSVAFVARGELLACQLVSLLVLGRRGAHTRIGHGNRLGRLGANGPADGRNNDEGDGTAGTDDDGPEERGALAGSPAAVSEGRRPEARCDGAGSGHVEVLVGEGGQLSVNPQRNQGVAYSIDRPVLSYKWGILTSLRREV